MEPFQVPAIFNPAADGMAVPGYPLLEREQSMAKDKKDQLGEMDGVSNAPVAGAGRSRKLDKAAQTAIGSRLRAYYDEVARETIPDRFVELLKQLENKDAGGKA
jgi:hypothetical protein